MERKTLVALLIVLKWDNIDATRPNGVFELLTPKEEIAQTWKGLLALGNVVIIYPAVIHPDDDFHALDENSILAIRAAQRITSSIG